MGLRGGVTLKTKGHLHFFKGEDMELDVHAGIISIFTSLSTLFRAVSREGKSENAVRDELGGTLSCTEDT